MVEVASGELAGSRATRARAGTPPAGTPFRLGDGVWAWEETPCRE